jgi:acetylglutamate kinase
MSGVTVATQAIAVIKVGGRAQDDVRLPRDLAARWMAAPGALCVVHGGGPGIDRLQRRLGATPRFENGRRVTSEDDMETVRMALSGLANKRLVASLCELGVPAVGVSGEDAGLILAEPDPALGRVGRPRSVNAGLLTVLLANGYLPVIAPVSTASDGSGPLNVNGDDAASAIAAALGASELLFVSDVDGVRAEQAPVATLTRDEAMALLASGSASGGMAVKLECALGALADGVGAVRIGGVSAIANASCGTTVHLGQE